MIEGLITLSSAFPPKETMDRLAAAVEAQGMHVVARIDHAAAAAGAGLPLRPTEVLIFGNPRVGTLLMQNAQSFAIDLPLKALVWQDEANKTWLSYNDPAYLAARHQADETGRPVLAAMSAALDRVARAATE